MRGHACNQALRKSVRKSSRGTKKKIIYFCKAEGIECGVKSFDFAEIIRCRLWRIIRAYQRIKYNKDDDPEDSDYLLKTLLKEQREVRSFIKRLFQTNSSYLGKKSLCTDLPKCCGRLTKGLQPTMNFLLNYPLLCLACGKFLIPANRGVRSASYEENFLRDANSEYYSVVENCVFKINNQTFDIFGGCNYKARSRTALEILVEALENV